MGCVGVAPIVSDLSHPLQEHSWLWALAPHRGPTLLVEVFLGAVRVRFGVAGPSEPAPCALCGVLSTEGCAAHALCCARAQSTLGHNRLARQLAEAFRAVDPGTEVEPAGLIPALLRPADVLSGAWGAGLTAFDVGIASPDAMGAGKDLAEAMLQRKMAKYAPHAECLDRQHVSYQPLV